ncbi:U2 snRNP-associated SURP motif-containing protein isoform X2 [Chrysoperla carnea]|uniref:U2 snRNP-associated SURP motif-containing protein isoform X2 n=1 Tax=Chrysoperla carnea TaxID=189513 RepID=UPI001D06BF34|nr:U2 snRNP-associated SURP motif-containing protein isoform X2 [Chrysoperla carnea]
MDDKTILKQLAEQKLKAFAVGNMGKRALTKRELEELRKKEEDEAAAFAFQEFVSTFQDTPSNSNRIWVKAGTYDAGARREDTKEKGKLYKPQSRLSSNNENLSSAEKAQEYARLLAGDVKPERLGKKKENNKKKSNLELFKEELKQIQEEREERHKYKGLVKIPLEPDIVDLNQKQDMGSFDNGDPNTTNLYLGNLNPKITETQLMELFGKYGPLASIKIMWPRSEEEKARGRNCGFVAFMNRKDGERALRNLNGKDVMGYEMKLGWGKCVPIPPHPIYIPPSLQELSMPPPTSGLPFNAQPIETDALKDLDKNDSTLLDKILSQSIVKVVVPTDRNVVALIHRTIEFVIREGPLFEAIIMNREINNPMFRFLFDNQSHQHTYYRWKLFSMMQGDTPKEWRTEDFRMFEGGSIWRPPPMNIYTQGMPDSLIVDEDLREPSKGALSVAQRDRLEELLRNLTPDRMKIAEAMVFAMEHSEAADEICSCIAESLSNVETLIHKKLARIYLVSDILHNCTAKINNASYYRRALEIRLNDIIKNANIAHSAQDSRLKAEGFKVRVERVLEAWKDWSVYPRELIENLENIFHGIDTGAAYNYKATLSKEESDDIYARIQQNEEDSDDGIPLDEDADGEAVPFDGAALLKGAIRHGNPPKVESYSKFNDFNNDSPNEDADGMPLTPPSNEEKTATPMFVPSRWETVDPEQVEAQAMTTSKWDQLEPTSLDGEEVNDSDSSGEAMNSQKMNFDMNDSKMSEERRRKLREVELKAMQYQDELEAGHRTLKSGWTVTQQVEHYRRKLLRKMDKKLADSKEKAKDRDSPNLDRSNKSRHSLDMGSSRSDRSKRSLTPDTEYSSSRSATPIDRKSRSRRSRSLGREESLSPPTPPRINKKSPSRRRRAAESPSWTGTGSNSARSRCSPSPHSARYLSPVNSKYMLTSPSPPPVRGSSSRRSNRHVDSPGTPPRISASSSSKSSRRRGSYSPNSKRLSPTLSTKSKHSRRTLTPSPPRKSKRARSRSISPVDSNSQRRHKHRY